MEALTATGWDASMTVESILVTIRANLITGGARLDPHNRRDCSFATANHSSVGAGVSSGGVRGGAGDSSGGRREEINMGPTMIHVVFFGSSSVPECVSSLT